MKTALERAMEKASKLGEATEEEKMKWKWLPEGVRLAGEYFKNELDLSNVLDGYSEVEREYVFKGFIEVLASNITLPKSKAAKDNLDKAIEGLSKIDPKDKQLSDLAGKIQYVITQYLQFGMQKQQEAYQQLKQQMEESLNTQNAMMPNPEINVEAIPEFQQQWFRIVNEIEKPYQEHLENYKKEITER